jgi:hypothetical protein
MSSRLRGFWKIVVLAAAVLVATSGAAQAQKLLRWKFTPGETLRFTHELEQSQNFKVGDTPVATKVTTTMTMTQKIDAVDSQGVASVTQTIDRLQMKMAPPPGTTEGLDYDSDPPKPAEGIIAASVTPLFDALVKKPFAMKIDPRGQVTDMKLPAGLVEALGKAGIGAMQGMFSEDALKQMTGLGLTLAEKPVAKDDTWSRDASVAMPMLGAMKTTTKYRYDGTETRDGKELDKIACTMQMDIVPPKDQPAAVQAKIGDQKTEGTIYFDNQAGRLVECKMTSKITMTVDVAGQHLDIQTTLDQTLRLSPPEKTAEKTAENVPAKTP